MTERKKLKISCGTVDCENGLHCYNQTKREAARAIVRSKQLQSRGSRIDVPIGSDDQRTALVTRTRGADDGTPAGGPIRQCKSCGAQLVDWARVYRRDILDVEHTFAAMRTEWIRHHFWHRRIDQVTLAYAYRRGREQLRERLKNQIRSAIGRAADDLWRDGAQTPIGKKPKAENILFFAQHATASCCRKCVAEWHDIPRDRALTEEEIEYLTALAWRYIEERLPGLPNQGGGEPPKDLDVGTLDVRDFEGDDVVPQPGDEGTESALQDGVGSPTKTNAARTRLTRMSKAGRARLPQDSK